MTNTNAYYTTETSNPEEPTRHEVVVTTDHPLSSYGQPVVIDNGAATPAQSFGHALCQYHADASGNPKAQDLVARANRLSGLGDATASDAVKAAFAGLLSGD